MHARMHLRTLTHINHRCAARSHVCRHVCSNMQAVHMKPAQKAGDCTAHRRGIASRGSPERRIAGPSPCTAPPAKRQGDGPHRHERGSATVRERELACHGSRTHITSVRRLNFVRPRCLSLRGSRPSASRESSDPSENSPRPCGRSCPVCGNAEPREEVSVPSGIANPPQETPTFRRQTPTRRGSPDPVRKTPKSLRITTFRRKTPPPRGSPDPVRKTPSR